MSSNQVRVRFAPSPTGHLHIGGLRTALFNWLFARHHDGAFLLRIEDTDHERSTKEYRDSILDSFLWMKLEHDEEILTQSDRVLEHRAVAQLLVEQKKAYRCFCSPDDLIARHKNESSNDNAFIPYDRYCRDRPITDEDSTKPYVIRFALPKEDRNVVFEDSIKGTISFNLDQFDDFVIMRPGGHPMYNFVVVIDDAFMKISHVIRGEEHIINTPKQILLYRACGYDVPQFAHLPLILGQSGEKLSKRDGATSVIEYRKSGYIPHALLNYLARLGWSHGDQELFSLQELIEYFSLEQVGKKGSIFDFEKLDWLNATYIRSTSVHDLITMIVKDVDNSFISYLSEWNSDQISHAINLYKERVKTLKELVDDIFIVYNGPSIYAQEDREKWISHDTVAHLEALIDLCQKDDTFSHDTITVGIKSLASLLGIKLVALLQPVRIALIGHASGPGVFDLLILVGKSKSIARLRALRATL